MGNLVFQATLGGQVNLVGPNTASTFNLNVPAVSSTIATTSGTETLTNKTLTNPVINGFTGDTSVVNIGSGQLYKDTSGNLGLGVTPSAWATITALQVKNASFTGYSNEAHMNVNAYYNAGWKYIASDYAARYVQSSGSHYWFNAPSGTAGNAITFTQAMTLDASGNLGLGTTSPSAYGVGYSTFEVAGSVTGVINVKSGSTLYGQISNSTNQFKLDAVGASSSLLFLTNTTERARIDSSGNLLVGKAAQSLNARTESDAASAGSNGFGTANASGSPTGNAFYSNFSNGNSTACLHFYGRAGGGDRIYIYGNGNVVNSNNSYGALSDVKLKENITDATPKLAQLNQVRVVNYNLIGEETKQLGVVAQELEQIFPSMVEESPDYENITTTDEDGNEKTERVATGTTTKSVKYSVFVPMLIKAMQEQQAIITQLQADVAALKGQA